MWEYSKGYGDKNTADGALNPGGVDSMLKLPEFAVKPEAEP
jgi:hypothetical protein